jgi:hypothetical protein
MPVDYEKLINLDYTAYEHSQDFQEKIDGSNIEYPLIEVGLSYENDVPVIEVRAEEHINSDFYVAKNYYLIDVTKEESEQIMFDIWKDAMKDLE